LETAEAGVPGERMSEPGPGQSKVKGRKGKNTTTGIKVGESRKNQAY